MDGWVGGRESQVKDCLQQSKITTLRVKYHEIKEFR
jgi:hypothetical protein